MADSPVEALPRTVQQKGRYPSALVETYQRQISELEKQLAARLAELARAWKLKGDVEKLRHDLRRLEKDKSKLERDLLAARQHGAALKLQIERAEQKTAAALLTAAVAQAATREALATESYKLGNAIITALKSPLLLLRFVVRRFRRRPTPPAARAQAQTPPRPDASQPTPSAAPAVKATHPASRTKPFQRAQPAHRPLVAKAPAERKAPAFAMCVTTLNRRRYIERFIETFEATRSRDFFWSLLVADDGSTDDTLDFLTRLRLPDCRLVIIENKRRSVAGQTNTLFRAAMALGFDFGAKADDDVYFAERGWDTLYYETAKRTGFDHLVYHNASWKPAAHDRVRDGLHSSVAALDCLGCFYTFTPRVLERVGFLDVASFPLRGHAHIDLTMRCCRAGYNEAESLWDAARSNELITMWPREGYIDLWDWKSPALRQALSPEERARRLTVIRTPDRVFVPDAPVVERRSRVRAEPDEPAIETALWQAPHFTSRRGINALVDAVFVLNLSRDLEKWSITAEMLARHGIRAERFPAVDGASAPHLDAWREYAARGLEHAEEKRVGRKLIQSPGAWGYLATMEALLEHAKAERLRRIIVFDDDVMLHRDFQALALRGWRDLPAAWSLVYLGCTQTDWRSAPHVAEHLYHPAVAANGSFAYAIDASVFDLALAEIRKHEWPFDSGALREVNRTFPESTFAFSPPLAIADVTSSTIRTPRDIREFADEARWDLAQYESRAFAQAPSGDVDGKDLGVSGLVSVLVVVEEADLDFGDCLTSLGGQTHGKMEVLVMANAAAHETALRNHASRDSRVRVWSSPEHRSRQACAAELLGYCRGELVLLHDASSVSHPDRLAHALQLWRGGDGSLDAVNTHVRLSTTLPPGDLDDGGSLIEWDAALTGADTIQRPLVGRAAATPALLAGEAALARVARLEATLCWARRLA